MIERLWARHARSTPDPLSCATCGLAAHLSPLRRRHGKWLCGACLDQELLQGALPVALAGESKHD